MMTFLFCVSDMNPESYLIKVFEKYPCTITLQCLFRISYPFFLKFLTESKGELSQHKMQHTGSLSLFLLFLSSEAMIFTFKTKSIYLQDIGL